MARSPAPPGSPPPHYRPPGAPRLPAHPLPGTGSAASQPATLGRHRTGPIAVTAIGFACLLLGTVVGFFLGRVAADGRVPSSAPPLTSPDRGTAPPPGDTVPQTSPTTAPSELSPTTLGSADEPIPYGQSYVLGLYEIEVREVDRDAAGALSRFNSSNPTPPPGQQQVLVEIAIRFNDANGLGNPASIPFFVSDGVREWYDFESNCGLVPEDLSLVGLLEEGDEVTGNLCFTVPADAVGELLFGTEGFAGPLYFTLPE